MARSSSSGPAPTLARCRQKDVLVRLIPGEDDASFLSPTPLARLHVRVLVVRRHEASSRHVRDAPSLIGHDTALPGRDCLSVCSTVPAVLFRLLYASFNPNRLCTPAVAPQMSSAMYGHVPIIPMTKLFHCHARH